MSDLTFANDLIEFTDPNRVESNEHEVTLMWRRPLKLARLAADVGLDREMFFKSHDRQWWILSIPREIADMETHK
jgi:hypothetical protein